METQDKSTLLYARERSLPPWGRFHSPNCRAGHFEDKAVSAWKVHLAERPQGYHFVNAIEPGSNIVFYSVCRAFRSVADWGVNMERWKKMGVEAHFVKQQIRMDSAAGKLLGNMMAAFAEFKAHMCSERRREANLARKAGHQATPLVRPVALLTAGNHSLGLANVKADSLAKQDRDTVRPGRVFRYARCSHIDQVETGLSHGAQVSTTDRFAAGLIEKHPQLRDGESVYDPAVSAYRTPFLRRPEGKRLDAMLADGDHVVFSRVDRGFRSVQDLLLVVDAWRNRGITVHFVDTGIHTDSEEGRMMMTVLGALAEYESSILSSMIADGYAAKREAGFYNSNLPPGIVIRRGMMVVDEDEQFDIERMWEMSDEGCKVPAIARFLESERAAIAGGKPIPIEDGGWVDACYAARYPQGIPFVTRGRKVLQPKWPRKKVARVIEQREFLSELWAVVNGEGDPERLGVMIHERRVQRAGGAA